ncbi:MAG: 4Fe-4S cluster-binding domain-containing protein [Capnocytophaga sp.]|nr:4Fe-4S cluster-binding domain-containing protein [Capnocytophaga sp.]
MYCHNFQIVTQEVPGEISLCFSISGCPLRCKGCHSPFLWKEGSGKLLTDLHYENILQQYEGFASCVLFMGGEWHTDELAAKLRKAKTMGYHTCLYTGAEKVCSLLSDELTWLKTGAWDEAKGGLGNPDTNQKFTEVKTQRTLNHLFTTKTLN